MAISVLNFLASKWESKRREFQNLNVPEIPVDIERDDEEDDNFSKGVYWNGVLWVRERFLGEGGFGSVFLVKRKQPVNEDTKFIGLPSHMAVKTALTADIPTLKHEKRVFSSFPESPYVIKCYGGMEVGAGEGERIYNYLFLEFCSGGCLFDYIFNNTKSSSSSKGLHEREVKNFTRDIVKGLCCIHRNGIVHCDIKPENILLDPGSGGELIAKLADFGSAKNMEDEDVVEEGCYKGTDRYMAPEYVKDKILTYPADIWALGCVVVEMLSGKSAWKYDFEEELFKHIGYTEEVPIFPKNISKNARDFLCKCFIKDFTQRWTAEELLEHPFLSVNSCCNYKLLVFLMILVFWLILFLLFLIW